MQHLAVNDRDDYGRFLRALFLLLFFWSRSNCIVCETGQIKWSKQVAKTSVVVVVGIGCYSGDCADTLFTTRDIGKFIRRLAGPAESYHRGGVRMTSLNFTILYTTDGFEDYLWKDPGNLSVSSSLFHSTQLTS